MTSRKVLTGAILLPLAMSLLEAESVHRRLYDGITAFVVNEDGKDFTVTLDVRDLNHRMYGPSELLVKVYPPDGKPVVREVVPDDGVVPKGMAPPFAGWDHEAWYYGTCYSRGIEPLVRWSAFSSAGRLAAVPSRTFNYDIKVTQKGIYRVLIVGSPDHYVTLDFEPELPYGIAGSPEWLHGHGGLYRKTFIHIPKTTRSTNVHFIQFDQPATRTFSLKSPSGEVLVSGSGADGYVSTSAEFLGKLDDQVLTLEISDGPGDYLVNVTHQLENEFKPVRAKFQAVTGVLSPDMQTARNTLGGAIYHEGKVFWQRSQVRLYEWVSRLGPEDFEYPAEIEKTSSFISVGSHQIPEKSGSADRIMHSWATHKNSKALNAAIKDMLFGMRLIGHGDHVAIGPNRNLAYEMGCYSYFWYRPAWRIIQQSNAPDEVKDLLREFVIMAGDRLAFSRTVATVNGNAFGSLMAGMRYCLAASQDPLHKELFDTIWERFTHGGYGERTGIGPSGGLQESFGYDYEYGSYVLRGWRAITRDLKDPRMVQAYNRVLNLYSYIHFPRGGGGSQWSSRTRGAQKAGGTYDPWHPVYRWKGFGGPDFTTAVNDHNEWFAVRRPTYYMVTYHGRLTPTWMGEGFQGQIGLGGGGICQLEVINKGQVIGSHPNGSYGKGTHLSQWRNFHVHGVVGETADGNPLVAANSEHPNARLDGNTVTSSGEVRESSVRVSRTYNYGPTAIVCEVSLSESIHDNVYGLWGGRPALRGKVDEAWEMIPFVDVAKRKEKPRTQKNRTKVDLLGADGSAVGTLTDASVGKEPVQASGVLITRSDFGVLIEFDEPRGTVRGNNDTVLVQLAKSRTPASAIHFKYHLVPFVGDPPKLGDLAGAGKKALPIARLDGIDSAGKVAAALAEVAPQEVVDGKKVLASLKFAVSGENFALHAKVSDKTLDHQARVWRGSCVEVFASMPGTFEIGQVFLAPKAGDKAAAGYVPKGDEQVPNESIRVVSAAVEGGYETQALIPLSLLKIAPDAKQFQLEFQVGADLTGRKRLHRTLFGSQRAYMNNTKYGLFGFEVPEEEQEGEATKKEGEGE